VDPGATPPRSGSSLWFNAVFFNLKVNKYREFKKAGAIFGRSRLVFYLQAMIFSSV